MFLWLNKQKADIIFLQETYSTKEVEAIWKWIKQFKGLAFELFYPFNVTIANLTNCL